MIFSPSHSFKSCTGKTRGFPPHRFRTSAIEQKDRRERREILDTFHNTRQQEELSLVDILDEHAAGMPASEPELHGRNPKFSQRSVANPGVNRRRRTTHHTGEFLSRQPMTTPFMRGN